MNLPSPSPAVPRALEQACTALWCATLGLMTAYMQTRSPAHRLLLARRIASSFHTLAQQVSFSDSSRRSFGSLQQRWQATAQQLARPSRLQGGLGLLGTVLTSEHQHL